nr:hypothetical protein CFP56_70241 [Quercus suber]
MAHPFLRTDKGVGGVRRHDGFRSTVGKLTWLVLIEFLETVRRMNHRLRRVLGRIGSEPQRQLGVDLLDAGLVMSTQETQWTTVREYTRSLRSADRSPRFRGIEPEARGYHRWGTSRLRHPPAPAALPGRPRRCRCRLSRLVRVRSVVGMDLEVELASRSSQTTWSDIDQLRSNRFDERVEGELGPSEYGEKLDEIPPVVGEGMRGLLRAIMGDAIECAFAGNGRRRCRVGRLSEVVPAWFCQGGDGAQCWTSTTSQAAVKVHTSRIPRPWNDVLPKRRVKKMIAAVRFRTIDIKSKDAKDRGRAAGGADTVAGAHAVGCRNW